METVKKILKDENPFDVNFLVDALDILSKETDKDAVSLCEEISNKVTTFPLVSRIGLEDFDFSESDILARGSYGTVYKVTKKDTHRTYVLKAVKKTLYVDYAFTERAILLTGDRHSSIQADFMFQTPLYIFFVMEVMIGTFDEYINCVPEKLRPYYTLRIAECLRSLHELGYCHGDLKPENIFLTSGFDVKLGDFGSSIPCLEGQVFEVPFAGTPSYAAPESFSVNDERGILCRTTDWYSFGIVMFQIFVAKHEDFYTGADVKSIKMQVKDRSYVSERLMAIKKPGIRNIISQILEYDYLVRPTLFDLGLTDTFVSFQKEDRNHVAILMEFPLMLKKKEVIYKHCASSPEVDFQSVENNALQSLAQKLDYCGWYFNKDESSNLKDLQRRHFELMQKLKLEQNYSHSSSESINVTPSSSNSESQVVTTVVETDTPTFAASPATAERMEVDKSHGDLNNNVTVSFKGVRYPCPLCSRNYSTKGNLKSHVQLKHAKESFQCKFCEGFFASSFSLNRHIKHLGHEEDTGEVPSATSK